MNKHLFKFLLAGFLQLVTVIANTLLALLPLKLASNSMSSVSWNG
jgi:hypothetical protein